VQIAVFMFIAIDLAVRITAECNRRVAVRFP